MASYRAEFDDNRLYPLRAGSHLPVDESFPADIKQQAKSQVHRDKFSQQVARQAPTLEALSDFLFGRGSVTTTHRPGYMRMVSGHYWVVVHKKGRTTAIKTNIDFI